MAWALDLGTSGVSYVLAPSQSLSPDGAELEFSFITGADPSVTFEACSIVDLLDFQYRSWVGTNDRYRIKFFQCGEISVGNMIAANQQYTIVAKFTSATIWELYINGVYAGSSGSTPSAKNRGFRGNTGILLGAKFSNNGVPVFNYDPNASDPSSTTLTDTIGGNDATFYGMGTEAWIDLGGGETVSAELVDSWSVFEAVNAALLDGWSVFATVSTSLADGWQVYNAVSSPIADAWTIQDAISSFLTDEWSVFNSASTELSDSWTIGGAASATLSDSWTVYNITGTPLTDEWRVLTTVSVTLTDEWVIYTTVNTELTDQWDIGGLINAVLTDSWRIGVIVPSRNYTFSLTPRKLSGRLTDREI